MPVFYNPRARVSRDVSVLVLRALGVKECVDAMCATGIRGIRYAVEAGVERVVFNDLDVNALDLARKNAELNGVDGEFRNEDVNVLLHTESFECVDVDPFGSPAPFLHAASHSVKHGGTLLVTATDTAPLCGASPVSALRKYHVLTKKPVWKHELSVRILLGYLYHSLGVWEKTFVPVLSFIHEHHVRVIVRVARKPSLITRNAKRISVVDGIGPIWTGPLHDRETCARALEHADGYPKEAVKILALARDEVDVVGYHDVHVLASRAGVHPPKIQEVIDALREKGFRASRTLFSPLGVKTDAPEGEVLAVISSLH